MKKKCERCGREFEARESFHRFCPGCFQPQGQSTGGPPRQAATVPQELLLASYYDGEANPLKQVYIGVPERLALLFAKDSPPLGTKQLRDFLQVILKARNKMLLSGIEAARPILYKCQADLEYQLKRGVIPSSFGQFMKHHLTMAERNGNALEGFYRHFDAVVCYFPAKK
ncbi:MAG: type III-A CRISPR-associated protein Csm2 [Syntrophorhabdaceae bacterium]|nr:type III-A CRISPR-associated protein Csm2 [Syntrophorhabdaceae bacterium]MDD5242899.1 type III-A CRISPR-associated protein Csm2 [Syntrophorhabdaceae bacterium]